MTLTLTTWPWYSTSTDLDVLNVYLSAKKGCRPTLYVEAFESLSPNSTHKHVFASVWIFLSNVKSLGFSILVLAEFDLVPSNLATILTRLIGNKLLATVSKRDWSKNYDRSYWVDRWQTNCFDVRNWTSCSEDVPAIPCSRSRKSIDRTPKSSRSQLMV